MLGVTASCLMGVLEPLLGKLSDILGNEFIKLKDNCCEISFLLDELSTMKIALETMSEQEEADPLGRQWMSQLQELAYDAEDVIDTFILHPSNISTSSGMIKKVLNKFTNLKAEYQFAGQIKQLKERTLEVSDRRKRYKMDHAASPKYIPLDPRLPALFEEPGSLVGIESQINDIVGFGGLGKTTLANLVFKKVSGDFECTAFVAASRSPDILIILRNILLQVCQGDNLSTTDHFAKMLEDPQKDCQMKNLRYTELVNAIRECLQDKRFLIVIDDIWSRQAWQQIRCVFPQNTKGSRIITTTRIKDVATYCSPRKTDLVHHITPLDAGNSRKLFLKRVFHRDEDCPADLKTTVDNILRKCQGLPLAIVNIGSLLANKTRSKDVWENVLTSLGAALEQDHELQMVQKILCLSYHDLPSHLKVCFLDLSTFPENYKIEVERLKKRWIAEGFVSERKGQCMEDTAESYIIELVNRNMIQPMDIEYDGKPAACQLHDIMLDLALVLSLKENFSTVMGGHKMAPLNKMRRLSLQGDIEGHALWQGRDLSHIRSLTAFHGVKVIPPLMNLHRLRLLDMHDCRSLDTNCIRSIGNLTHLRYISLRGENITRIPGEIGQLRLLQTLDVRATGIVDLPASVGQLDRLICLLVSSIVRLPHVIKNMSSLEELSIFNAQKNSTEIVEQLGSLKKLKILRLWWYSDGSSDNERNYKEVCLSSLCMLGDIQTLQIDCMEYCSLDFLDSWCPPPCRLREFIINGLFPFFSCLPQWINLSELTTLQIGVQHFKVEDMKVLEGLPALLILNIDAEEAMEEMHTVSGFQNLKTLDFCTMLFGGMGLKFGAGGAQRLEDLSFSLDAKLIISAQGSLGIVHLSSLKELSVHINCQGSNAGEVVVAEAAIRSEVARLPNHLTTHIIKR